MARLPALGGLCHSHVLEKGDLVFYQVLRITVSSVHDGHHALVLGALALAFRCRQILVSTVPLP